MNDSKSNPPRLAIWLLRNNEALSGDLVETFREGKSRGWFWRQVLLAIAVSHWPEFCYAIAAAAMPIVHWIAFHSVTFGLRWWELQWPWSQILLGLRDSASLTALPVLGVGLWIHGTFRWVSLLRTQLLSFALLVLHTCLVSIVPWLQIHETEHSWRDVYIPRVLQLVMILSFFLFSAWVGCVSPRRAQKTGLA